ncbi:MAG TPA: DUF971 domain-containing protein [Alphaproteobacteria bacterium]|nr:DUF971 domain-containing protein [Alphaproteobacteria bacterium]
MNTKEPVWPRELVVNKAERQLQIVFDNGESFMLPAEYLRTQSPSAEVQGHSEAQRQTVGGKRNVGISGAEPVGNYAVRLLFDDGHSTGIFSWTYLHELGREQETRWTAYLKELAQKGLGRDP